ncbi:hypothetical protein JTB14_023840 [Gonioctena quinquepunctata]|nr:hypothetical protein JTB14_023840 [Gonioctena quinquepunctata]
MSNVSDRGDGQRSGPTVRASITLKRVLAKDQVTRLEEIRQGNSPTHALNTFSGQFHRAESSTQSSYHSKVDYKTAEEIVTYEEMK